MVEVINITFSRDHCDPSQRAHKVSTVGRLLPYFTTATDFAYFMGRADLYQRPRLGRCFGAGYATGRRSAVQIRHIRSSTGWLNLNMQTVVEQFSQIRVPAEIIEDPDRLRDREQKMPGQRDLVNGSRAVAGCGCFVLMVLPIGGHHWREAIAEPTKVSRAA